MDSAGANSHRLKADAAISVANLEEMFINIMNHAGTNDLASIVSPLASNISDSLSPSKCVTPLATMSWLLQACLDVAKNTKLPKKNTEIALEQLNARRRWHFGHG